jgi:large-conductance mechanosensitive channel
MLITFDEFKHFLVANNVLAIAAGIAFGQATLQMIRSFVADVMLPLVYLAVLAAYRALRPCALPKWKNTVHVRPSNFAAEVVTYVLIVASAFVLINNIFRGLILRGIEQPAPGAHISTATMDSAPPYT